VLLCLGPFVSKENRKAGNDWCREIAEKAFLVRYKRW